MLLQNMKMVIFSELSLIPNFSKTQNIQYVAQFDFADKEFAKYVDTYNPYCPEFFEGSRSQKCLISQIEKANAKFQKFHKLCFHSIEINNTFKEEGCKLHGACSRCFFKE